MPYFAGPAYANNSKPETRHYTVKAGETFKRGAVLVFDSGTVAEGGTNPTGIVGLAGADAFSNLGYELSDSSVTSPVTGRDSTVPVMMASATTEFKSKFTNGSAVYIAPVATDVGIAYGLTKQSTGEWTLDKSKTTTSARATVTKIDIPNKLVFWTVNPADLINL